MEVATQVADVILVSREVQIEPQERDTMARRKTDLEIIGEQLELSISFPDGDAEIEPCPVAAFEVRNLSIALLILFTTEDAERMIVEGSHAEVFAERRRQLLQE